MNAMRCSYRGCLEQGDPRPLFAQAHGCRPRFASATAICRNSLASLAEPPR